jgi:hypothetical protein
MELNKKKVMFIGNSFIYYGYCVIEGDQGTPDLGYFHHLARVNGDDVTVYDYVWGGRNLNQLYEKYLPLDNKELFESIDCVFMSEAGENNRDLVGSVKRIMALFPEKTKFVYLCHTYTYQCHHARIMMGMSKLRKMGVTIVNWGGLAYDIWKGRVSVPGGKLSYNKDSFVVNKHDWHHQNMLSGYICSLMAYCAVTGKSAVGQPYGFCNDTSLDARFDAKRYMDSYYVEGTSNLDAVFASEEDMRGLQILVDEYIKKYN